MKSLGNFPDPFIAEISGQPEAIRRAADGLTSQLATLERLREIADARPPIFTGMGSSYFACHPAVTELADAGRPALHVDASELLHFRANLLGASGVLVAVSQSGESAEIVRLLDLVAAAPGPPIVLAVTNGLENTLARRADLVLDTRAGPESGPSTMTFAGALVVVAAIGRVLSDLEPADVVGRLVGTGEAAAAALERLLDHTSFADELAAWHGGRSVSVILGRGPARAAAEMGALTLKEAVGLPIESLETAQFRHGPLELSGPALAAIVIATEPQTRELDVTLAGELADGGAAVIVVVEGGTTPRGVMPVALPALDRALAPAVSILPAQLLSWKLAVLRGRPPGAYLRGSKVTTRE